MSTGKLLVLVLTVATIRLSCACVAMKPKDFDDVMPLTRIPPTNPLWTTEAMPTTAEMNEETTSATSNMETTSATSTSTSTSSTTTTTRDPCDMCLVPTVLPLTDDTTSCGLADTTLPSIMISVLPNGMNCELVVTGCVNYEILTVDSSCDYGTLSPNIICQNGGFESPTAPGESISRIRCNVE